MSDPIGLSLAALGLPLLAAVLAAVMGCVRPLAKFAHVPVVLAFAAAAVLAALSLAKVAGADGATVSFVSKPVTWFAAGGLNVSFGITVDPLSAVMLATVTFVATWIAVFSASYMHGDSGYARYFALMALFVFSMSLLVLANNFLLLLAGWEGVGVCSYLLVGYYYAKPSAAAAARKAFLVTRLGDVGFLLGIFLFWQVGGYTADLDTLFKNIAESPPAKGVLTAACLLLFCGAVGKSAQLPLYVWLPDAMEGPTPVSALIHAATMVTAGVYLLARTAPLFAKSAVAQEVVCIVGGLTALLAAFIALAQTDLKRVLAYSTVSQLGFMFMALGTSGFGVAPNLAIAAAVFHLFTHAFFKALLFLGSGSVMHAMGNVIDMRRFGGLKSVMPVTRWTFLIGSAALAGVPLLSGFWSKDQILDVLWEGAHHTDGNDNRGVYFFVYLVASLTAFLTAFYTFRAYFLTFHGEERVPPEAGHHAHESPWMMLVPLIVLATGAAFAGLAVEGIGHNFSEFLARTPSIIEANRVAVGGDAAAHPPHVHMNWTVAGISSVVALLGVGLAWRVYGKGGPEVVPASLKGAYTLSQNKVYVDEVYAAAFVKPAELLAALSRQADGLLDGLARFVGSVPRFAGAAVRPLQNGLVQFYALGMALGLAVFLTVVVFRTAQ